MDYSVIVFYIYDDSDINYIYNYISYVVFFYVFLVKLGGGPAILVYGSLVSSLMAFEYILKFLLI